MQTGALVISLDFELHWGVRDHCSAAGSYVSNILGARRAIPRILDVFEEYDASATWASVGFLFATSRSELIEFYPKCRPSYLNRNLDPYGEEIGENEQQDELHYAWSLLGEIQSRKRQEIATHTFSHFYCLEPQENCEAFKQDLDSAVLLAAKRGIRIQSIVFPRNQVGPEYVSLLPHYGITAFRGAESGWMYQPRAKKDDHVHRRAARFVDNYVALSGDRVVPWNQLRCEGGLCNVRGSMFLRPYSPAWGRIDFLRFRRIESGIRSAAEKGGIFHLWWHPHNFGSYLEENLAMLQCILRVSAECRKSFGMQSLSMAEVASRAVGANVPSHLAYTTAAGQA